ncbi:MAG: biotin--[acetyl-CoA-carboxylase] ligase [Pirellulaceae bacterium]
MTGASSDQRNPGHHAMFDVPRILRSGLVGHVDYHSSLGSTNDRALALAARDDAPLPLLVLTEQQTLGRGRGTNRWWSAAGAITFSLVLDAADALTAAERPRVALVAGLAVCEALESLVPRGQWQVKWPNDVLAGGGKVCGILCESVPGWPERLVVGVGINVNNSLEKTPVPVAGKALIDLDGLARDLTQVLIAVLDRFDLRWSELLTGQFADLAAECRKRCFLTGKTLTVTSGRTKLVGRCQGIDERGALVLVTESGPRAIVAGSIDGWE